MVCAAGKSRGHKKEKEYKTLFKREPVHGKQGGEESWNDMYDIN